MEKECRLTCGLCTKKQKNDIIIEKTNLGNAEEMNSNLPNKDKRENLPIEELKEQESHGLDHNSLPKVENEIGLMNVINRTIINPETLNTVNHLCHEIKK